jgi:hypothetical protein
MAAKARTLLLAAGLLLALAGGAFGQSPDAATPDLFFSINDQTQLNLPQGSPLVLLLEISNAAVGDLSGNVVPVEVDSTSGNWASVFQVQVRDSSGNLQSWPLQLLTPANSTAGALLLTGSTQGKLIWVLSASNTAGLAVDSYELLGVLDNTGAPANGTFVGLVSSNPVLLTITAASGSLSASDQEAQAFSQVYYNAALGNPTQAFATLNSFLIAQPGNLHALTAKGDLQLNMGQYADARKTYNGILSSSPDTATTPEPPVMVLDGRNRATAKLLSQMAKTGAPRIIATLSDQGMQSAGVFFYEFLLTNVGPSAAQDIRLQSFQYAPSVGTGVVTYDTGLSGALPVYGGSLTSNSSTRVRIYLDVPSTLQQFFVSVSGIFNDTWGNQYPFSFSQNASTVTKLLGDLNSDGAVNCSDLAIVKASFGKKAGQTGFDARADVNGDGVVNVLDLSQVAKQVPAGTTCP